MHVQVAVVIALMSTALVALAAHCHRTRRNHGTNHLSAILATPRGAAAHNGAPVDPNAEVEDKIHLEWDTSDLY